MFTKKLLTSSCLAISLLASTTTAFASNQISCAEYAQNAAEREGITWDEVVNYGSGAIGSVAGGMVVIASAARLPMERAGLGTKAAVYLSIAGGAAVGGLLAGGVSYLITSNFVDIVNLSDEVELGGTGITIQTMINSIQATLPADKLNDDTRENIRTQIERVIKNQPQICDSSSPDEILKNISEEVKRQL
ncbi:MAG: hypothetical protein MK008_09160 [Bdellovibrionales bacterium]|nr:hypothetical protein [Bdellovibrionales bacterium]